MSMDKDKLLKIVKSFRYGMIGRKGGRLQCYKVCAPLQGYLSMIGIETKLIEGDACYYRYWIGHYWLEMEDGKIIDPTAEQFATEKRLMPRVYIGVKPRWYRKVASL